MVQFQFCRLCYGHHCFRLGFFAPPLLCALAGFICVLVCSVTATQEVSPQLFLLSASSVRLKCGFELSFNICSLHYISKFSPRVRLHYEKRKMKTQQTPAIYPPMLASGLFKQGNPVEKVTLNLLLYRDKPAVAIVMKEKKRDASKRYSNFQLRMGRTCEFRLCIG
ncbi:uncharacterized protein LOC130723701 isoform X8 [Lotus japonicus]|uniref:uncharacterized protein LOC130723701 isoform X8 n=1 Tax=Lotus japonicus TaxID=34305 RepID=UPI00258375B2|nr:uncharacterized protein LOC130723701 isoform X8 [Lotus japonicus]